MKLYNYETVFSLFAKCECRIQKVEHIWTDICVFCVKVSDKEGKMVLTP